MITSTTFGCRPLSIFVTIFTGRPRAAIIVAVPSVAYSP